MKKHHILSGVAIFMILLAGCAKDEVGIGDEDHALEGNNEMEVRNMQNSEQQQQQFGYVRYNENQLNEENENYTVPQIDREEMANIITRTLLKLPEIEEAATLLTDSHAFVAFTKSEDVERDRAIDTVKMTVQGTLPRWFHVYISDDSTAYQDLQSLSNNGIKEADDNRAIESLIERFTEQTPQGTDYSDTDDFRENY